VSANVATIALYLKIATLPMTQIALSYVNTAVVTSRMTVCAILQRRKIVETNVSTMKNATLTMNCA
jgi:hypothetical protein